MLLLRPNDRHPDLCGFEYARIVRHVRRVDQSNGVTELRFIKLPVAESASCDHNAYCGDIPCPLPLVSMEQKHEEHELIIRRNRHETQRSLGQRLHDHVFHLHSHCDLQYMGVVS